MIMTAYNISLNIGTKYSALIFIGYIMALPSPILRRLVDLIIILTGVNIPRPGQVDNDILQNWQSVLIQIRANHCLHVLHETLAGKDIKVRMTRKLL